METRTEPRGLISEDCITPRPDIEGQRVDKAKAGAVKVGLQIPNLTFPGGPARLGRDLARVAREAEQAGFDSLWVMDHFYQIEFIGPADREMLEAYSTLAYLAAVTQSIRLGALVTGITYRYPGVLVKTMTTLDVLSGGRGIFGLGAAWFERENRGLGVPFPPLAERFERLEEILQLSLQMWSPDNGPFQGKHYQLEETLCVPQPVARPYPPLLIGGMGEKKTLRLVAQYAQACNLFAFVGPRVLSRKLQVLREHCQDLGRDYASIEKTSLGQVDVAEPNRVLEQLHELAELGIDTALVGVTDPSDPLVMKVLAETIVPGAHKLVGHG